MEGVPRILQFMVPTSILFRVSIAINRHHNHGNSYKGNYLVGVAYLKFRGLVHYHHGGTWWHAGRHGAGDVAESPTSYRQQEMVCLSL